MLGYKRETKQFYHAEDKGQPGCTKAQKCHLIIVEVSFCTASHPRPCWARPGTFSRVTYLEEIPFTCTFFALSYRRCERVCLDKKLDDVWKIQTCNTPVCHPAPDLKGKFSGGPWRCSVDSSQLGRKQHPVFWKPLVCPLLSEPV